MMGLASTTVSILRGTTVNDAGDVEDDNTNVAASGIPAAITKWRNPLVYSESNYTPRTLNWYRIRLPRRTVIQDDDRIKDEKSGEIYLVNTSTKQPSIWPAPDLLVDAKKIN